MNRFGFTLLELLIVVSVISLLVALVIPGQRRARRQARVVMAHADLRQITVALDSYAMSNGDSYPPARSGCGTDVNDQLPVELADAKYLPRCPGSIPQADLRDIFDSAHTYKYRAPGAIYFNGTLFDTPDKKWRPRSRLWVPNDFPNCRSADGAYYADYAGEIPSPVSYAVWSIGPDANSPKFPRFEGFDSRAIDDARFPLQADFWMHGSNDTGLITHFRTRRGIIHTSP